jgi:MFS family permease
VRAKELTHELRRSDRHDPHADSGATRSLAVVASPLEGDHRARHGLDPRRARGHDRVCRFFTGFGIGGEYSAINSAIDELIPAKRRGRVDVAINGSYWAGAACGALLAVVALNTSIFVVDIGWRLCFGLGAVLGLGILLVRRSVPESPRWLFIHGREREAEDIAQGIERRVEADNQTGAPEPDREITVRQRRTIPLSLIVRSVVTLYPRRTVLGMALFIGQAFLYNSILFGLRHRRRGITGPLLFSSLIKTGDFPAAPAAA